jgi:Asp/Glu/hydantoin racemase
MRTLFLNPNSSDSITAMLSRRIGNGGWTAGRWAVKKTEGAPEIIGSLRQNLDAEAAVAHQLAGLSDGFDRVVMMSSLDTGYEVARQRFGDAAFGFTRSVLAHQRRLGHRLQVVTFDRGMTDLYKEVFEASGQSEIVHAWTVLDLNPAEVAARPEAAINALQDACSQRTAASDQHLFIVGIVGIELAAQLHRSGVPGIVDPLADLLSWLGTPM